MKRFTAKRRVRRVISIGNCQLDKESKITEKAAFSCLHLSVYLKIGRNRE